MSNSQKQNTTANHGPDAQTTARGPKPGESSFADIEPVEKTSGVADCWTSLLESIRPDENIEPLKPWTVGCWSV